MLSRMNALRPLGLLLLRFVIGASLLAHGLPKLMNTATYLQAFPKMGMPAWAVYVAAAVEVFGGGLLLAGLFTRIAAFFVSGEMFVVFLTVHWKMAQRGPLGFLGSNGDEYPLLLCVAAFLLFTTGAGAVSLDRMLFKDKA